MTAEWTDVGQPGDKPHWAIGYANWFGAMNISAGTTLPGQPGYPTFAPDADIDVFQALLFCMKAIGLNTDEDWTYSIMGVLALANKVNLLENLMWDGNVLDRATACVLLELVVKAPGITPADNKASNLNSIQQAGATLLTTEFKLQTRKLEIVSDGGDWFSLHSAARDKVTLRGDIGNAVRNAELTAGVSAAIFASLGISKFELEDVGRTIELSYRVNANNNNIAQVFGAVKWADEVWTNGDDYAAYEDGVGNKDTDKTLLKAVGKNFRGNANAANGHTVYVNYTSIATPSSLRTNVAGDKIRVIHDGDGVKYIFAEQYTVAKLDDLVASGEHAGKLRATGVIPVNTETKHVRGYSAAMVKNDIVLVHAIGSGRFGIIKVTNKTENVQLTFINANNNGATLGGTSFSRTGLAGATWPSALGTNHDVWTWAGRLVWSEAKTAVQNRPNNVCLVIESQVVQTNTAFGAAATYEYWVELLLDTNTRVTVQLQTIMSTGAGTTPLSPAAGTAKGGTNTAGLTTAGWFGELDGQKISYRGSGATSVFQTAKNIDENLFSYTKVDDDTYILWDINNASYVNGDTVSAQTVNNNRFTLGTLTPGAGAVGAEAGCVDFKFILNNTATFVKDHQGNFSVYTGQTLPAAAAAAGNLKGIVNTDLGGNIQRTGTSVRAAFFVQLAGPVGQFFTPAAGGARLAYVLGYLGQQFVGTTSRGEIRVLDQDGTVKTLLAPNGTVPAGISNAKAGEVYSYNLDTDGRIDNWTMQANTKTAGTNSTHYNLYLRGVHAGAKAIDIKAGDGRALGTFDAGHRSPNIIDNTTLFFLVDGENSKRLTAAEAEALGARQDNELSAVLRLTNANDASHLWILAGNKRTFTQGDVSITDDVLEDDDTIELEIDQPGTTHGQFAAIANLVAAKALFTIEDEDGNEIEIKGFNRDSNFKVTFTIDAVADDTEYTIKIKKEAFVNGIIVADDLSMNSFVI
jgi:hypothetical protein